MTEKEIKEKLLAWVDLTNEYYIAVWNNITNKEHIELNRSCFESFIETLNIAYNHGISVNFDLEYRFFLLFNYSNNILDNKELTNMLIDKIDDVYKCVYELNMSYIFKDLVKNQHSYNMLIESLENLNHKYEIYPIVTLKYIEGYWRVLYYDYNISREDLQYKYNYFGNKYNT